MNSKLSSILRWGSIIYLIVVLPNIFVTGRSYRQQHGGNIEAEGAMHIELNERDMIARGVEENDTSETSSLQSKRRGMLGKKQV